ncbi:hypothetical protein Trydic_g20545 [Trypoxylus dichotomus]
MRKLKLRSSEHSLCWPESHYGLQKPKSRNGRGIEKHCLEIAWKGVYFVVAMYGRRNLRLQDYFDFLKSFPDEYSPPQHQLEGHPLGIFINSMMKYQVRSNPIYIRGTNHHNKATHRDLLFAVDA